MREVAKYYEKWEKVDFSWHHIFDLDLLHIFFAPLTHAQILLFTPLFLLSANGTLAQKRGQMPSFC